MMKLFLALALLSSMAFAEDPRVMLLEKHTTSGYVLPEHRFKKDCSIFTNGDVEVTIQLAETASGFTAKIGKAKLFEIRSLISIAKRSAILVGPVRCDAGNHIVTGHRHGYPVLIKEEKDCMSNKTRKGWAAKRLRAIAAHICQF